MLNFDEIGIQDIVVHYIGSKAEEEGTKLSNTSIQFDEVQTQELLKQLFLTPFKPGEYYHLNRGENDAENTVYSSVSNIFADPQSLVEQSQNLANHLYNKSEHPKIKKGELYVVHFDNCFIEGETINAIGLFKSETKERFLKVKEKKQNFEINFEEGINKLDKGCLIFNMEQADGYLVSIVDTVNKGEEARYWRNAFLNVKPRKDEYHQTKSYLDLCKSFALEQAPKEFEVSKADQADFLNQSATFFKKNEDFTFDEFANQVIKEPGVIDSFKKYKKQYAEDNDLDIVDEFVISSPAVKKQSKVFKSVIKLDKNFHIYVHGNRENIVRGFDEKTGMHYYQLFFKDEE